MPTILTYPGEYYVDNHSRHLKLMDEYKANMLEYLQINRPNIPKAALIKHINTTVRERYKPSTLSYLSCDTPCNVDRKEGELLEVTNELNSDILSPYGASYLPTSEQVSVFSEYIGVNKRNRKRLKHEMFLAEAANDKELVNMKDLRQRNVKININVLSGVMLSNVSFRSSINYNAITATARFNIMTAYSVTEMALASNYYFYNEDKAINWIISLMRIFPGDRNIIQCIEKYNLNIPTSEQVFNAYAEQVRTYSSATDLSSLKSLIYNLSANALSFVYYAMNFKRIFQDNPLFKKYFDYMLDTSHVPTFEGEVPKVAKLEDGLIHTLTVIVLSSSIGKLTMEDIDAEHPELARSIYSTYLFFEQQLNRLENLFDTFLMLPIVPSDIGIHKNMIRKTVLLSDTDSILFTNMDWVQWYTGDIKITDRSSRFNAVVVTLISKLFEHVFAYMSASMNIGVDHIHTLAVKNEFMYDLFLRTPISKHYAGYVKFREGVYQDPYKFDLKGKNFKGSDLCKETTSYVKWFIKHIFDNFLKTYELHPKDFITKVIIFEQRIKQSIAQGEVTFLTQKPINLKEQYKKPESSNFLYYELWQAVFAEKYGDLNLPQKTKELPIDLVSASYTHHLNHIKTLDPSIYEKFIAFVQRYPKKKFSRVLIPMDLPVPEELRAIANYRKVCAANCYSLELLLRSFNIVNYPNKKEITLFSDTYSEFLQEITDEQREQITRTAAAYDDRDDLFEEEDTEDYEEEDDDDDFTDDFE